MISKLFAQLIKRKFTAGVLLLLVAGSGYWGYAKIFNDDGAIRYATAQVQNGTLIVSISGNGQVSASNQVDVKPKASGEITAVYAKLGQEVGAGAILAAIDARDAERAVRDAETALETAKLESEKLLQPADAYSLMQAENSLIQAKDNLAKLKITQARDYQTALDSKQKAEDNVKKAYEDGFNAVSNAFLDLPGIMTGLHDMLIENTLGGRIGQRNIDYYANTVETYDVKVLQYKEDTGAAYQKARASYDKNFADYKSASRFSDGAIIESLIGETYDTTKDIAETIKNAQNLIQFYKDKLAERSLKPHALADTHLSNLGTYTGKTNSHLSNLLSVQRTLKDSREAGVNAARDLKEMEQNNPLNLAAAERTAKEKEEALVALRAAPDDLDTRAKKIAIRQREDALATARQTLADHYVRAPFGGVITKVNAQKGDSASVGTTVATLITKQKIAEVSLSEIDVAKVKADQKVTLTFDAIGDLTITGQVAEIDAVGTVSQGVVTYTVKIAFDTHDDRVKTAMSVSAAIVTEAKPNALLVPNSAVKSQGGMSYVEIVDGDDRNTALAANVSGAILKNSPRRQNIEVGTASDEFTEIISGLNEGDLIVTRTIQPTAQTTQTQQQSGGLRIPGIGGGGGGGGFRGGGGVPR